MSLTDAEKRAADLLRYAEKLTGVCFFKDKEELEEICRKVTYRCAESRLPTEWVVDGIYTEWKVWEPYLDKESLKPFFLAQLEDLFRIHAAATSSSPELKSFVGSRPGIKIINVLPIYLGTCVNLKGNCLKDGKVIS